VKLRARMRRGAMAALLLAQGTPMLLMGDEVGRSQGGNNNAYCQDNELNWLDWRKVGEADEDFFQFTAGLIRLRKRFPLLAFPHFLHGGLAMVDGTKDVTWLRPDGTEMQPPDWTNGFSRSIALMLARSGTSALLILLNAHHEDIEYRTPKPRAVADWRLMADSGRGLIEPGERPLKAGDLLKLPARCVLLFEGRNG